MDVSRRAPAWLAGLAILAAAAVPYLSTLGAGFVFDDHFLVEGSRVLRGPLSDIWIGREVPDYWPLTWTSLWMDLRLYGLHPAGYHAENILLHAATSIVFWRTLLQLKIRGAWLGAVLFAVHPVAVESVAWISERKNVLSGVLFAASLLTWVRFDDAGRRRTLALSLALFVMALLAKSSVVMLPVGILLLVLLRRGTIKKRDLAIAAPYFGLALVFGSVTVWFQATRAVGIGTVEPRSPAERIGGAFWALTHYVRTAVLPVDLGFSYPAWPVGPSSPWFWAPAAMVGVAAIAGFWSWHRFRSRWVLGFAFHAAMVFPILGLIEIAYFQITPVSNHLQYLALFGPAAVGGALLASAMVDKRRRIGAAATSALVFLLGTSTASRALAFQSDLALWSSAHEEQPGSFYAAWSLSDELARAGHRDEALDVLRRFPAAARDEPSRLRATALLALQERRLDDATNSLLLLWHMRPAHSFQEQMGHLMLQAGRPDLAAVLLRPLVERAPDFTLARLQYAEALARAGRVDEAIQALRDGLGFTPRNESLEEMLQFLTSQR